MMRPILNTLLVSACGAGLLAQSAPPTISSEVKQNYQRTRDQIIRGAAKMPEEGYALRPTGDVRTFAQVISHIAEGNAMICGGVVAQTVRVDTSKTSKGDVMVELTKSFNVCDKAYDSLNETNGSQLGGSGFMGGTLVGRLYANLIHDNEMYGTMVVYLRLKGIVPPSSEGRGGR